MTNKDMDKTLLKTLHGAGLSFKQARVYAALLILGEATVQELAKEAAIKRPTAYVILEELKEKQLAFEAKAGSKTIFVPEQPRALLERVSQAAADFSKQLPNLESLQVPEKTKPRFVYLDGSEGFKKIWRLLFVSGQREYLIMTDPQEMLGFVRKRYITDTIIRQKIGLGIKSRQLVAFSEYAKEIVKKDKLENRVSKIIPHTYKLPYTTIIFGDTVAFISPAGENVMMVANSASFAKSQRSLFELLWAMLPESKVS
jgi:sugar-specific transcriptional regulator TrmB